MWQVVETGVKKSSSWADRTQAHMPSIHQHPFWRLSSVGCPVSCPVSCPSLPCLGDGSPRSKPLAKPIWPSPISHLLPVVPVVCVIPLTPLCLNQLLVVLYAWLPQAATSCHKLPQGSGRAEGTSPNGPITSPTGQLANGRV